MKADRDQYWGKMLDLYRMAQEAAEEADKHMKVIDAFHTRLNHEKGRQVDIPLKVLDMVRFGEKMTMAEFIKLIEEV